MTNSTYFNESEFRFAELLRKKTIKEAAKSMGWSTSYAYNRLDAMRNKVKRAHNTVNVANNWKNSARHPRLAKLLRRQKNIGFFRFFVCIANLFAI